jgi:hypothetical protein
VEKENAEEMAMLAPRSNAYGRQHDCSRHAIHDVLGVHGWVATTSFGCHHRGSLHGSLQGRSQDLDIGGAKKTKIV